MPIQDMPSRRFGRTEQPHHRPLSDELSRKLRNQACLILIQAVGSGESGRHTSEILWRRVFADVCAEHGLFELGRGYTAGQQCLSAVEMGDTLVALDVIELALRERARVDECYVHHGSVDEIQLRQHYRHVAPNAVQALAELDRRFVEAGVTYRFHEGRIIL